MRWLFYARVVALGAAVLLLGVLLVGYAQGSVGRTESLAVLYDAPAFTLTDQLERPFSSDELRGQIVVADFIYTSCQDICPLLTAQMYDLQERLRREHLLGSQVQLLSFSVDPANDTPAVLRAYSQRFRADPQVWRFLTGPTDTVRSLIVDGFHLGVVALPPAAASPRAASGEPDHQADQASDVLHSGKFVLIDPAWRIRVYYDGTNLDLDRVVQDIRQLRR